MIPASPAVMAPPIKKQRAGNTPEDPIAARTQNAINDRSERLQNLALQYRTATMTQDQPKQKGFAAYDNSVAVLPQSRRPGESIRGGGRVPPTGMNDISRARGPPLPVEASTTRHTAGRPPIFEIQQSPTSHQKSDPPPKTGMVMMQPRRSDIFPSVTKQSPISSKPSTSFVTAAAIKSPQTQLQSGNGTVARRLEESFQANNSTSSQMRSKSAPPTRPPPPPGPPPLTKGESAKNVTFQLPNTSATISPQNSIPLSGKTPENTTTLDDTTIMTKDAGTTPFYYSGPPGATPYRSNGSDELPTPPTTARRDLLRNMRAYAESPEKPLPSPSGSVGSTKSPELRLHEQLASSEKDRTSALRNVAKLEDEIAQLKQELNNTSNHSRNVGFMSPVANIVPSLSEKRNRRIATPFPKSRLQKPSTPNEIDEERRCLLEATKKAPFEYESKDGITYIVRRPFGLANETDFWYKIGQLPAKLYANSSNVEIFSSIEIAASISCDNSIFLLFDESNVRHQSNLTGISMDYGNVDEHPTAIGNVMYVDKNAIDKEYSLDDLYEFALTVRGHYCTTVRSFAAALQLYPEQHETIAPPLTTEIATIEVKSTAVETAEKGVATDNEVSNDVVNETKDVSRISKQASPPDDEATSDVLASFLQMFFSMIFGTVWFIFVKLPFRILTTTFIMAVSVIVLSFVLLFCDDNGELGATMRIQTNRPGIL